jgi:hypothetical protein
MASLRATGAQTIRTPGHTGSHEREAPGLSNAFSARASRPPHPSAAIPSSQADERLDSSSGRLHRRLGLWENPACEKRRTGDRRNPKGTGSRAEAQSQWPWGQSETDTLCGSERSCILLQKRTYLCADGAIWYGGLEYACTSQRLILILRRHVLLPRAGRPSPPPVSNRTSVVAGAPRSRCF